MDSVWVLRKFVPYEGSMLLGIYKTKRRAEEEKDKFMNGPNYPSDCSYHVEEWHLLDDRIGE